MDDGAAERIAPGEFDVIVLGSGLPEALIARCVRFPILPPPPRRPKQLLSIQKTDPRRR